MKPRLIVNHDLVAISKIIRTSENGAFTTMMVDLSKHKEAYLSEARSHIKMMNRALLSLEKTPDEGNFCHQIFRSVHTLKSLAATMGYSQSMSLCHAMENLLDILRDKKISLNKCTDLLFKCFDQLSENLKKIIANLAEPDTTHLVKKIDTLLINSNISSANKKLSDHVNHVKPEAEVFEKIQTIEVKVERLEILMNLAEELLVSKMKLDSVREEAELIAAVELLGRLITDLQYHVIQVRLVPIAFIFNRFPRMVRDLAKQQKKYIDLEIEGGEIELDRLWIDEIGGVITHLVRNSIDHGLEIPSVRKNANKPKNGKIKLRAIRTKETVVLEISDDGAGLNLEAIKARAIKQNILTPDATDHEIKEIIFSGLSTTKSVTLISGRGLGLSIAKQKVESIGGTIRVESTLGKGTSFFIEIPLSLAIINTLFVKVGEETYAIPIDSVERLLVVKREDFKNILNYEAIIFEETDIPIIRLSELFNEKSLALSKQSVVIIRKDGERLGLAVDGLVSTQDVIIKPLSLSVKNNKYFSGAAMTGSGKMVLILDATYLLRTQKPVH
jgi:two-component system chemotaxis sensor kinase CheA